MSAASVAYSPLDRANAELSSRLAPSSSNFPESSRHTSFTRPGFVSYGVFRSVPVDEVSVQTHITDADLLIRSLSLPAPPPTVPEGIFIKTL